METRILGTKGGIIQKNLNEGYEFESEIYVERNGYQYDMKPRSINDCPSSIRHFADCIVNKKPHIASGEEGLIVMQILDAIYKSAKTGKPIRVG